MPARPSWPTRLAWRAFGWGVVVTCMAIATLRQDWDTALMLAVLQWAPAIWTGQAWDRLTG